MKPAVFEYRAPDSLDDALALLDDEDARPLAGGQSLIPMLNFRLAFPAVLVDLNPVVSLDHIDVFDGSLRIGAMTRQAALLRSTAVAEGWPLLTQAVSHVGHAAIRSRGTVGGSVAHADPAAELPVALTALDARFRVRSVRGERVLSGGELFRGALETALEPGELLVDIEVPPQHAGARMGFAEHVRTHGDFAIAGAAVVIARRHAAIALLGAAQVPVRAAEAERGLVAGAGAAQVSRLAAEEAEVGGDHRRALLEELVRRALERARA